MYLRRKYPLFILWFWAHLFFLFFFKPVAYTHRYSPIPYSHTSHTKNKHSHRNISKSCMVQKPNWATILSRCSVYILAMGYSTRGPCIPEYMWCLTTHHNSSSGNSKSSSNLCGHFMAWVHPHTCIQFPCSYKIEVINTFLKL